MKFLVFLVCSLLLASAFSFVIEDGKSCNVGDRVLKHNEIGPAEIGECTDVQCINGELRSHIGCGLIQLKPGCAPSDVVWDLKRLYPDCCYPVNC